MYNDSFKLRYKTAPIAISITDTFFPTKPHNHSEIEILLILKGGAEVHINGNLFRVGEGDMVFVNPLEVHSLMALRNTEHCHKCICFDSSVICDNKLSERLNSGKVFLPCHIPFGSEENEYLRQIFLKLYSAVEQDNRALNLEVSALINEMFAYFVNNSRLQENMKVGENTAFCDRVLRFIAENYHEDITSRQAADSLSFNQSYFCRNFKRNFGMSFSNYLNMYRVSASKKLIENGNENIADIAFKCGFQNPDYFTKCFKSLIGMSPMEYRKSQ